jgi:DNA gyrase subunit B
VKLEDALQTLERRGLNLTTFLARATERGLPVYKAQLGNRVEWFYTAAEVDAFREAEQAKLGRELVVGEDAAPTAGAANNGQAETFYRQEMHEVREINKGLEVLKQYGLNASHLLASVRVAGREPPPRLVLEHNEQHWKLAHLRDLGGDVRKLGEKGLSITRFKGLGEMDPEELWDTTLDPTRRTLLKVQLDDALKADEMFRTLMGEKVEPRRDFITKYALDVKDIDWHGA